MKKNHHLHRQIHLCLIILLLLFCSSSQVFASPKVKLKNTKIKLSATKLTYNKKVQRPKIRVTYKGKVLKEKKNYIIKYSKGCKNVGTYTVQIIGKGTYIGTVKKQFVILPPKAQIMNIYAKTAAATVVVKRQPSQTSGYQLRYATNSKLKNAKTITVKGNKNNTIFLNGLRAGTTYYLQTRTYMTVKGKKYYSKWSSTGHCTTNKGTNSTHQSATPTPTPKPTSAPIPKLTFEYGAEKVTLENGEHYNIQVSNHIKNIDISDPTIAYSTVEAINGNSCLLKTLEPGKCVITITDIYGQKLTSTVSVTQKLNDPHTQTSYTAASETVDSTLPIPTIKSIDYDDGWMDVHCRGTLSQSDSYIGYEGYLSYNDQFKYSIHVSQAVNVVNGAGNVVFTYLDTGHSYYIKVRSYTIRNNVKIVGPWSEIRKADLPAYDKEGTAPAKYTYEIYGLDKQKADIYTDCLKPLFIKTDNPDPNSFSLIFNGNDSRTSAYRSGSSRFFDDIPLENNDSETTSLEKVKGGYIKYVKFFEAGTYTVEFREYSLSGYTVANTVTLNVLDYEQAKNAWMIDIINKTTTADMTPFEKMDAISAYLREPGRFKYLTRYNDHTVSLAADPNEPFFVTYRWNSSTSPAVLGEFAELVGGFDDIHYCFGDYPVGSPSWSIWHYVVKLTIGNETRNYAVCPMGSTGNVEEIKMIDFSDLSNMRKFG